MRKRDEQQPVSARIAGSEARRETIARSRRLRRVCFDISRGSAVNMSRPRSTSSSAGRQAQS